MGGRKVLMLCVLVAAIALVGFAAFYTVSLATGGATGLEIGVAAFALLVTLVGLSAVIAVYRRLASG